MKKYKLVFMAFVILGILAFFLVISNSSSGGLVALSFDELQEKIDNKESFVLCLSQTTCSHCADYKPKLDKITKEYGIYIYYTDIDLYSDDDFDVFKKILNFGDKDGTPMTLFFIDGKEESIMSRMSGDVSELSIIKKLEKYGFID